MLNERMVALGTQRSVIRELFEFGKVRAAEIGAENVFDFSIGNPSVPAPDCVNETAIKLLKEMDPVLLHGYTSAQGDALVRKQIADNLNVRFGTAYRPENLYMTVGAAASLCCSLNGLCNPGDEIIVFAPFFPEYRVFIEGAGAKLKIIPADVEAFQIDFAAFEAAITEKTKAVIVNSPNNPSGTIYSEETVKKLASVLEESSQKYGQPIFLLADEPYREIAYDGVEVPFVTKYYNNTLVCYSYSKSLSLPGERIGWILVPDEACESKVLYAAVAGAGRALGYVCAPSLFQKMLVTCIGQTGDVDAYKKNRDLLYDGLTRIGYECFKPDGAFYMFVKALEEDADAFCEKAKEEDLLIVSATGFGCPGYVRISYCVDADMIQRSFGAFERLYQSYQQNK